MATKRQQIAAILAELGSAELDTLADMEPDEIAALVDHARRERETRERLSGTGFVKIRVVLTVQYEARDEQTDRSGRIRPGRIIARSAGPDPVEVWVDGQWVNSGISLSLPEGYEGKGTGWWENYSLKPTSSDYAPINWVRFNHLLKLLGAVHGPELSPGEFATLPGKALRSAARKPVVLAYLMGAEGPELDGLGGPSD